MAELRSDSWKMEELLYQTPPATVQGLGSVRPGRKPVTDVLSWCECFTVMAAIITSRYPEKASQLFSYMRTIVRASQTFDGPAWVSYDSQFRRKAASLKSWDWGIIDSGLYNECFTGRAKAKVVCTHCLSDSHQESQCPLTPGPQVSRIVPNQASGGPNARSNQSRMVELCGLFNRPTGNECKYINCRFAHICSLCRSGPHPASACSKLRRALLGTR